MDHDEPGASGAPPADPEEWSDEQWLAWLRATDDDPRINRPVTLGGRVTHSSGGQVLGQAMLGLAHAMYGRPDDPIVVVAADGSEPAEDQPFDVKLDPDHPERSRAVFRPLPPAPG